ncbi:MAG TPA: electron transporter RnfE [Candidatus Anaerofilum faecale]|nr:electron transporter RnfE [Candidatus Anaerofilum faecale]
MAMWAKRIVHLNENFAAISRRDRVFLNNPVVMNGVGLAPLVIAATTGLNALMLSVAVLLMITPTRVLSALVCRWVRFRALVYCLSAAVVYIGAYYCMQAWFSVEVTYLGMYLPLLVVEPIVIRRYEQPAPEKISSALKKGLLNTAGYVLVILLVGMLRELLAQGALFGQPLFDGSILPLSQLAAGGFIVVGVLCAVWRGAVNLVKKRVNMEAKKYQ